MSDITKEEMRKDFESHFSESAIQRDAINPEKYWNDPMQYKWEGFILGRQSSPDKSKTISAELKQKALDYVSCGIATNYGSRDEKYQKMIDEVYKPLRDFLNNF